MIQLRCKNDAVEIRGPNFGDSLTVVGTSVVRRARDDTPYSYKSVDPGNRILDYDFSGIDPDIAETVRTFINTHANEDIILTDPEGDSWSGRITTQPFVLTQSERYGFDFHINFEGKRNA